MWTLVYMSQMQWLPVFLIQCVLCITIWYLLWMSCVIILSGILVLQNHPPLPKALRRKGKQPWTRLFRTEGGPGTNTVQLLGRLHVHRGKKHVLMVRCPRKMPAPFQTLTEWMAQTKKQKSHNKTLRSNFSPRARQKKNIYGRVSS